MEKLIDLRVTWAAWFLVFLVFFGALLLDEPPVLILPVVDRIPTISDQCWRPPGRLYILTTPCEPVIVFIRFASLFPPSLPPRSLCFVRCGPFWWMAVGLVSWCCPPNSSCIVDRTGLLDCAEKASFYCRREGGACLGSLRNERNKVGWYMRRVNGTRARRCLPPYPAAINIAMFCFI